MRIAVIADIHGNLPALEAVLDDLAGRSIAEVIDLGDCVSGPLWPRETCELLMARGFATVRGNHDRQVTDLAPVAMGPSDAFARAALDPRHLAWLATLPPRIQGPGFLATHGVPGNDTAYLLDRVENGRLVAAGPDEILRRLGSDAAGLIPGLVLCGHSHQARLARPRAGLTVLNPGSVGLPAYEDDGADPPHVSETGAPHARYAVVTLVGESPAVDFIALPYDHEAAAARAADNGRADWARALRTGRM
ncbi:metallophosphoesterase family protein [Arenibaculum pallidiluteum]|uniref:metallophosphoesterase family protein n=1 Tax=Arenibaculum pallidiluteum TaxID=2812559 RepID=UPI001A964FEF|nr:metallophosphoesterase family protein [Arenibaculum pallidiluteum]